MEFRILGPLEVEERGSPIELGGPKQRKLLALLLLTPNRPVSVDRLIDGLWPTDPPAAAANALQYHVSQLRKALGNGAMIATQEPGYLIRLEPEQLDLLRFEQLVIEAEGAEAERAGRLLAEALALWRVGAWAGGAFGRPRRRRSVGRGSAAPRSRPPRGARAAGRSRSRSRSSRSA